MFLIVDASFPYKTQARWVVSLRVVDQTLYTKSQSKTGDEANDSAQVVFYAKNFEDLPIAQRIGDIIRVHRAKVSGGKFKSLG